ncbi:ABC transporter substrate-binding protein [Ursidibacter sp. B-7004-1]
MTKSKRKVFTLFLYISLLFILSLGGIKFTEGTKISPEHTIKTLRLGLPGISNSTLEAGGIAVHNKYFEEELAKEGYKLEIVFFQQAGPALNEALASNKIDVALYGDLPITILKSKGADVKVFAIDNSNLQFGTIVQNESQAKTIADLQGKKVIYGKGTVQQRYFNAITKSYQLDPKNFEMVNSIGADANSVFSGRQADAIFAFYYTVLFMESKGMGRVIESTLDKPEISSQSLAVGRNEYLVQNERAAVAMIRGLKRAKEFAAQNPSAAYNIFAQNNIPAAIYEKAYSADLEFKNFEPEITATSIDKLNQLVDFLIENKLINTRVNVNDLITTKYYQLFLQDK